MKYVINNKLTFWAQIIIRKVSSFNFKRHLIGAEIRFRTLKVIFRSIFTLRRFKNFLIALNFNLCLL